MQRRRPPDKGEGRPPQPPFKESDADQDDQSSSASTVPDDTPSDRERASGMTKPEAEELTARIKHLVGSINRRIDQLVAQVKEAQAGDAHLALGYRSWPEYVVGEFGDLSLHWDREDRRELVALLSGEGMSTRAIAPIAGVSEATVRRDLSGASNDAPERSRIIGVDGKRYRKSKPKPQPQNDPGRTEFNEALRLKVAFNNVNRQLAKMKTREDHGEFTGSRFVNPDPGWAARVRVEILEQIPAWRNEIDKVEAQLGETLDEHIAELLGDYAGRS